MTLVAHKNPRVYRVDLSCGDYAGDVGDGLGLFSALICPFSEHVLLYCHAFGICPSITTITSLKVRILSALLSPGNRESGD